MRCTAAHPATQAWNRELLAAAGIEPPAHLKFVAADLAREPLGIVGEPWLSHFVPADLVAALSSCGFAVTRDLDPQELLQRFAADGAERPRLGRLARLMWAGAAPYTA